jgi:hypothetical protein
MPNSILYISENMIFASSNGKSRELHSQRIVKYKKSIESINKRKEWKNTGTGAQFMDRFMEGYQDETPANISGISKYEDGFIYSINIDTVGGLYKKTVDDDYEGHITANDRLLIRDIDIVGDKCAASVGNAQNRSLAVFELPSGNYTELTEGDTREDFPSFSKRDDRRILFSSAGLARQGRLIQGPYAAMVYDTAKGEMSELFAHDELDFIRVKEDSQGSIYCIKRPYNPKEQGNVIVDFFLFPFRMIKAIFGFFNVFSVFFGGESLRSGKNSDNPLAHTKSKQKSEQEMFIDGNVVNAERQYKLNKQKGEKFPGLIPHSWELIRIDSVDSDEKPVVLKRGVLDYTLCENGDILYSNGRAIVRMSGEQETLIEKCKCAVNIIEI